MIKIITDSTCDLPDEIIAQYGITVVPSYIIWGNKQYLDRVSLTPEQFYDRIKSDPVHPTTSQPTLVDFLFAYDQAVKQGAEEIICITVSSAMSGTYMMAVNAGKLAKVPVFVVDSKGPTMMLGWQVLTAARAVAAGKNSAEVLTEVEKVRQSIVLLVGMETLSFLDKGGRIGDAVMWLGNVLAVKPLVEVNRDSGKVVPITLVRTHKSMVEGLYNRFVESLQNASNFHIAILHGNALAEAQKLAERILNDLHPVELITNITGPILGINTGPGALALCGYGDNL
ncbi:MAG: DegV family protein [Anaerolineaceae bacterium]|jgi:DegV family protein with EDD domain